MSNQVIYTKVVRSATTARQINAARTIAPHVLRQTFTLDQVPEIQKQLPDHVDAFLVSCDLVAGRYYLVLHDVLKDTWTSTGGSELVGRHVAAIKDMVVPVAAHVA
jgi:hypothetical protein